MATKNDFENGTKKVKSGNLPLEQLKNEKLGRVLTAEEITAVKWWAAILASDSENYENGVRDLVVGGNIDNILQSFLAHGNDKGWAAMESQKRSGQKLAMQRQLCTMGRGKMGRF